MNEKLKTWVKRNWFPCILYALLVFLVVALWSINYHPIFNHNWFGPSGLETQTNDFWFTMFAESIIVLVAFVAGHIFIGMRQKRHRAPVYKGAFEDACSIYNKVYDLVYGFMAQEGMTQKDSREMLCNYYDDLKEEDAAEIIRAFRDTVLNSGVRINRKKLIHDIDFIYSEVENYLQRFGAFLISSETEQEGSDLLNNFNELRRVFRAFKELVESFRPDEDGKICLKISEDSGSKNFAIRDDRFGKEDLAIFRKERMEHICDVLKSFRKNVSKKEKEIEDVKFHTVGKMIKNLQETSFDSTEDKKDLTDNIFVWAALFNMRKRLGTRDSVKEFAGIFWRLYWDHTHRHRTDRHRVDEDRANEVLEFIDFNEKMADENKKTADEKKKTADEEAVRVFNEMIKSEASIEGIEGDFYRGLTYWFGPFEDERRTDYGKAIEHFEKAAKGGHPKAQYYLGIAKIYGYKKDGTYQEAWKSLQEAEKKRDADALNELGILYMHAVAVPRDEKKAAEYFHKAAEQGHPHAQNNLGIIYSEGWGVEKSDVKAVDYFREARKNGNKEAGINLGVMYLGKPGPASGNATEEAAKLLLGKESNARASYYCWRVCGQDGWKFRAGELGSTLIGSPWHNEYLTYDNHALTYDNHADYSYFPLSYELFPDAQWYSMFKTYMRLKNKREDLVKLRGTAPREKCFESWLTDVFVKVCGIVKEILTDDMIRSGMYRPQFQQLIVVILSTFLFSFRLKTKGDPMMGQYCRALLSLFAGGQEAEEWFEKAAASSEGELHSRIQYWLGLIYLRRGREDPSEAEKRFLQAADSGHPLAAYQLGLMYFSGRDSVDGHSRVPQDYSKAEKYFQIVVENSKPLGDYKLGSMYEKYFLSNYSSQKEDEERDTKMDAESKLEMLNHLKKEDYLSLEKFFHDSRSQLEDLWRMAKQYVEEKPGGSAAVYQYCHALLSLFAGGQEAEEWFKKAAASSEGELHNRIQYWRGLIYLRRGREGPSEAEKRFLQAADSGHPLAAYQLGLMYFSGHDSVPQDYGKAEKYFQIMVENSKPLEDYKLGSTYVENFPSVDASQDAKSKLESIKELFELKRTMLNHLEKNDYLSLEDFFHDSRSRLEDLWRMVKPHVEEKTDGSASVYQYCHALLSLFAEGQEAEEWFKKAAASSEGELHSRIQYWLGLIYLRRGREDPSEAEKCFLKAADSNHPRAAYQLGLMYFSGRDSVDGHGSVPQDYSKAEKYLQIVAENSKPLEDDKLGTIYEDFLSVDASQDANRKLESIKELFEELFELKHTMLNHLEKEDYLNLEDFFHDSRSRLKDLWRMVKPDVEKKACGGAAVYQYCHALLSLFAGGQEVEEWFFKEAEEWFKKAAASSEGGLHNRIQYWLGLIYLDQGPLSDVWYMDYQTPKGRRSSINLNHRYRGGTKDRRPDTIREQNLAKAREYLRTAAEGGNSDAQNSDAQYQVGLMYRQGQGGQENPSKAEECFRRAADLGHPLAAYQLGRTYFYGHDSVQQDYGKAEEYFKMTGGYDFDRVHEFSRHIHGQGKKYSSALPEEQDYEDMMEQAWRSQVNTDEEYRKKDTENKLELLNSAPTVLSHLEKKDDLGLKALEKWLYDFANRLKGLSSEIKSASGTGWLMDWRRDPWRMVKPHVEEKVGGGAAVYQYCHALLSLFEDYGFFAAPELHDESFLDAESFREAEEWFKKAAASSEGGLHNRIQYWLGLIYLRRGTQENLVEARTYLDAAASDGISDAQYRVGLMYCEGRGGHEDPSKAEKRFRRAADLGHPLAAYQLGLMYFSGHDSVDGHGSVSPDYSNAKKYFQMVVDVMDEDGSGVLMGNMFQEQVNDENAIQRHLEAYANLGGFFVDGYGRGRTHTWPARRRLNELFKFEPAISSLLKKMEMEHLKDLEKHLYDSRSPKDLWRMVKSSVKKKAHGGAGMHQYCYALLSLFAGGDEVEEERFKEAEEWFKKAAACGKEKLHNRIQYWLGLIYLQRGTQEDLGKARRCLRTAAEGGCFDAQYQVGLMYRQGQGGKENPSKAEECFQGAADSDSGYPLAAHQLGLMYFDGHGSVQRDYSKAEKYFKAVEEAEIEWGPVPTTSGADPAKLGLFCVMGDHGEKMYKDAFWRDQADALAHLGFIYMRGGDGVEPCDREAERYFKEAANLCHADAMFNLGLICLKSSDCSRAKAIEWFEKAWEGDVECDELGPRGRRKRTFDKINKDPTWRPDLWHLFQCPSENGPGTDHYEKRKQKMVEKSWDHEQNIRIGDDRGDDWWPRYRGNWVALRFLESLYPRGSDKAERCREKFEMTGFTMLPVPDPFESSGKTDAPPG